MGLMNENYYSNTQYTRINNLMLSIMWKLVATENGMGMELSNT